VEADLRRNLAEPLPPIPEEKTTETPAPAPKQ
jgi:hypothetical protein